MTGAFLMGGLISGTLAVTFSYLAPPLIWFGVGLIFLLGVVVSALFVNSKGWLCIKANYHKLIVSSVVTALTYPLAVLITIGGAFLSSYVYRTLFPVEWARRAGSPTNEDFFVGLSVAVIFSAALISLALYIYTNRWYMSIFFLMSLSGLLSIPLSIQLSRLTGSLTDYAFNLNWYLILFLIGATAYSSLCGEWLLKRFASEVS